MSYSERFIKACLQDETIARLISQKQVWVDSEEAKMRFETSGAFSIKPINFHDDDTVVHVTYKDTYHFAIMLDDAIGYLGPNMTKSVHLFSILLEGLLNPADRARECTVSRWLKWRLIRLKIDDHTFVSAPFDDRKDFAEVPGTLVDLFGRKTKLRV